MRVTGRHPALFYYVNRSSFSGFGRFIGWIYYGAGL